MDQNPSYLFRLLLAKKPTICAKPPKENHKIETHNRDFDTWPCCSKNFYSSNLKTFFISCRERSSLLVHQTCVAPPHFCTAVVSRILSNYLP